MLMPAAPTSSGPSPFDRTWSGALALHDRRRLRPRRLVKASVDRHREGRNVAARDLSARRYPAQRVANAEIVSLIAPTGAYCGGGGSGGGFMLGLFLTVPVLWLAGLVSLL